MIVLGLTGSIGMGKSTTASLFSAEGAAVYDADAAVHALYESGGGAAARLAPVFPTAVMADGAVNRDRLRELLTEDPSRLKSLETQVFPMLTAHREAFLDRAAGEGRRLAVLDIPLLYETASERLVDAVVVATASPEVQRSRVLSRPGMTVATFEMLCARQLPDGEKRRRADFIVYTDAGLEDAARQVRDIVSTILAPEWASPPKQPVANASAVSDMQHANRGEQG